MRILSFILIVFIIFGCKKGDTVSNYNKIINKGEINIVTSYNSIDYFIYKGEPMGYQYEIAEAFCNDKKLKLNLFVCNNINKIKKDINKGSIDIVAGNLIVTKAQKNQFSFTAPHSYTRQVLIQRKLDKKKFPKDTARTLIRNQIDLANKKVSVEKRFAYIERLNNLSNEIGDNIIVDEIPDYQAEQLIGLVANGEIDYTVCNENIAIVISNYYKNIDIKTPISFKQNISWAVNKNSTQLLDTINAWFNTFTKTKEYRIIYDKYFRRRRGKNIWGGANIINTQGSISKFDDIIKKESAKINWDWRLLSALIYQESRFNPNIKSWVGARGLMQLMPRTAKRFGVVDLTSPKENIKGGVKVIKWLEDKFMDSVTDPEQRVKFVLASYNVGIGHVLDAIRLAKKYGKATDEWDDNVDFFLRNKSDPKYYNDPVVKFGYCRGKEPYEYVKLVFERYDFYKNTITL